MLIVPLGRAYRLCSFLPPCPLLLAPGFAPIPYSLHPHWPLHPQERLAKEVKRNLTNILLEVTDQIFGGYMGVLDLRGSTL